MDVYKLYATGTAGGDGLATLEVSKDGWIVLADLDLNALGADALGDGLSAEVSFASTNGLGTNDTKSSFIATRVFQNFLTSGGGPLRAEKQVPGIAIPVSAGERLHLHAAVAGTPGTFHIHSYIYVMPVEGGNARPLPRRAL